MNVSGYLISETFLKSGVLNVLHVIKEHSGSCPEGENNEIFYLVWIEFDFYYGQTQILDLGEDTRRIKDSPRLENKNTSQSTM